MKQIMATACALVLAALSPAAAQSQTAVVVELYTSQGCSSCPPADEYFAVLAQEPGIIALALHVDYWDYLGWKDIFADPKFTARQKSYAKAARDKMIYTPQMIVQGQERIVGSRPDEVAGAVAQHRAVASPVKLTLERIGDRVRITAAAEPPGDRALRVQLVRFRPSEQVDIRHGENAGRSITYHNVVRSWQQIGQWNARAPLLLDADAPGSDPVVVIIQAEGPAEIVAAAQLR